MGDRGLPAQDAALQLSGQNVGHDHEGEKDDDAGENTGGIISRGRLVDEQAEALCGRREFADDHADDAVRHGHSHAEQDVGRGSGKIDMVGQLALACAHHQRQVDEFAIDRADAGIDVVEDEEEHHDPGERIFDQIPIPNQMMNSGANAIFGMP